MTVMWHAGELNFIFQAGESVALRQRWIEEHAKLCVF